MDEPTIGLDLVVKDNIRAAIREINEKYQTTVVLTTHDIQDIEELCSRIIIIDKGRLIYDGSLTELKDKYGTIRKVIMEVSDVKAAKKVPLHEYLSVNKEDYEITVDTKNSSITVAFDKNKLQVSDVIKQMMEHMQVKDIKIQETELGEIVKAIYNHTAV